jgi:hypothetical protein
VAAPELSKYYSEKEGDGRGYWNPVTEQAAPSITTVLKLFAKDLTGWAAYKTAEFYAQNPMIAMERSEKSAINAGRGYYKQFRDDRAEVGTGVHETIEAEHTGSWNYPDLDAEQDRIMAQWAQFNTVYEVKPVYSEVTVWNHTHEYAGTADGLWWVRGPGTGDVWQLLWIDLKTSKSTWPDHWMQLSAISHAECLMVKGPERPGAVYYAGNQKAYAPGWWTEEPIPAGVSGSAIVHLREDKWEFLREDADSDLRWEQFKCYRSLYALEDSLKRREKGRKVA